MRIDLNGDKIIIYEGGKKTREILYEMFSAIEGPIRLKERLEKWGYTPIEPINS